jgi:hypothetical protein
MNLHIAVPVYNTPEDAIKRCLKSISKVMSKKYNASINMKLYLLDDCSTNKYKDEVLHPLFKSLKIDAVLNELPANSGGLFQTRVSLINLISPNEDDYILFVDSDDELSQDYVDKFLESYMDPGCDVYFPLMHELIMDEYSNHLGTKLTYVPDTRDYAKLIKFSHNIAGKIIRAKMFNTARVVEDYNCFLGEDLIHSLLMSNSVKTIKRIDTAYKYYIRSKTSDEGDTEWRTQSADAARYRLAQLVDKYFHSSLGINSPLSALYKSSPEIFR